LPTDANSGPALPDGKNILKGQKVRLIKQAPGECTVSTPKANSQALFKEITDYATRKKQITALFAGDLNLDGIIVDVNAKKNGTTTLNNNDIVQCNDTIDTNISFRAPGRKPADIMLVDDKSGSMSWDGQLALSNEQDIFYDRNYVFIADGTAGLRDINVEIPNKPSIKGTYNTTGTAYGVHVSNNTAFVADGTNGLVTINVTNKDAPSLLGTLNNIGDARKVFVQGNTAFVATITDGSDNQDFNIYTISNTTDLYVGQSSPTGNSYAAQSFTVSHKIFVITADVYVKRNGNPNGLTLSIRETLAGADLASASVGSISTSYNWRTATFNTAISLIPGKTYYLVLSTAETRSNRYYTWQASTANPYANGNAYIGASSQANTDAFLRIYNRAITGLQAIDITSPTSPSLKSSAQGTDPTDVFVNGNYAYFSDGTAGLKIIDISNDSNIFTKGSIDTTDAMATIASGNYAFIADGTAGLRVIDTTNKSAPSIAATLNTAGTAYDLKLYTDNNIYLADDSNLLVINASNPLAPVIVKGYGTPYNYQRIDVNSNWAFLTPGYAGLVTMNIYSGPKIDQLKKADTNFVNFSDWKITDQIGLVSFQGSVTTDQTLLTATDTNRQTLINKINSLVANNGTAMFDAICAANRELSSVRARSNSYKFQIAMTDGVSNSDTNSHCETSYGAAYDAKALGIKVYTIGFGPDADTTTLQQIASITDANYYAATDENALQEVYDLIRRDIGAVMADQNAWDKNFSFFIPLYDQNFVITPRNNIRLVGDKNYLVFDINLMTENDFTQSAFYSLKMPCQNNKSCDNNSIIVPDSNSYFDNITNPYDFNQLTLIMQYRDLRVDLTSAFSRPNLDLNALVSNIGYQTMNNIAVSFYDGNAFAPNKSAPITPSYSNPNPITSILQQASTKQQNVFSRDYNDYYLWAVIDSTVQNDCPRYNEALLHCTQQKDTQYYIINYWVWQK
jgi:hypothetical protein